jgi:hypothetical protein
MSREDRTRTPQENTGKTPFPNEPGANSGAVHADFTPTNSDLQLILANWANLPKPLQQGILAMIRAAIEDQ